MPSPELPAIEPAKPGEKKTMAQTVIVSMPVVLTVLATILAGISSSEMTQAQYHRALAAQNQSKAGDQWAFYQAKKIRGSIMQGTSDTIDALADPAAVTPDAIKASVGRFTQLFDSATTAPTAGSNDAPPAAVSAAAGRARAVAAKMTAALNDKAVAAALKEPDAALPAVDTAPVEDANLKAAMMDVRTHETDKNMTGLLHKITPAVLTQAIDAAQKQADTFDAASKPATSALDHLAAPISSATALLHELQQTSIIHVDMALNLLTSEFERLSRNVSALRLRVNAARSDRQAAYNQAIAELYEVQVHKSGADSDRHRTRSSYFFMGMLLAQAGVTIATVSLSLQRKSVFLGLAAAAGLIAVSLSAYIFMAM